MKKIFRSTEVGKHVWESTESTGANLTLAINSDQELWVLRFALERYQETRKLESDRDSFDDAFSAKQLLNRLNLRARDNTRRATSEE